VQRNHVLPGCHPPRGEGLSGAQIDSHPVQPLDVRPVRARHPVLAALLIAWSVASALAGSAQDAAVRAEGAADRAEAAASRAEAAAARIEAVAERLERLLERAEAEHERPTRRGAGTPR
jgi:hypothetical protein